MSKWVTHPLQRYVGQGQSQDSHSHPPCALLPAQTLLREEENRRLEVRRILVELGNIHEDLPLALVEIQLGCTRAEESIPGRQVVEGKSWLQDRRSPVQQHVRCP